MTTTPPLVLHASRLRNELLAHAAVESCAVLPRTTAQGDTELASYVVLSGPFAPERLHAYLVEQGLPEPLPAVYVPLAAMPRTADGQIDEEALRAIPVLDAATLARFEEAARALPGVERAAAVLDERTARRPALHLSDLIPGWTADATAPASAEPVAVAARPEAVSTGRLSLSEGLPIAIADDEPVTLPDALRRAASQFADQGMVYVQADGSESFQTYAALKDEAERILGGLRALGLKPGDAVLFQLDLNQDFLPAFWGCTLGGFIPVPISIAPTYDQPNANTAKLHNAWLMLDQPIILCGDDLAPRVQSLTGLLGIPEEPFRVVPIGTLRAAEPDHDWHESQPDDLAILLLTSGSTGKPKGVTQRHSSLLLRSAAACQDNGFTPDDISLNWFPMDHVGGIVMFHLRDVYLGARQVHAPTNYVVREPLKWLDLIEKHRITNTWAPNFAYGLVNARAEEVAKGSWDLSTLRFILNAGEAIVARTARRFVEILAQHGLPGTAMRPAWGMSETCSAVTYAHDFTLDSTSDDDSFVVVGTPIPGFAMRIVGGDDQLVAEGAVGKLQVRGPSVTRGYFHNDDANRESFTADGWFNTGDLGVIRNGAMTITGRQKDVIIINGVNFYSHEIESVAEEVDGVEVSFTAACPVRVGGRDTDDICIFFHSPTFAAGTEGSVDEKLALLREIRGAVVRNVGINPNFLVPVEKAIIPKTEIGKIQRPQLRARFEAGEFDPILKELEILTGGPSTVPDWFFRWTWTPQASDSVDTLEEGVSLVLPGAGAVAELMKHYGPVASTLEEALALGPIRRVVHFESEAPTESLLALVQALTRAQSAEIPVRLLVVSRHAQAVLPTDTIVPERATLPGLIKTIPQELPHFDIRHVDIDEATGAMIYHLLSEMQATVSSHADREIAYRSGRRLVCRMERAPLADLPTAPFPLGPGGLALVTGGLGGIGVEVAERLLAGGARVLLIGRSALNGTNEALARLEAAGEVRYVAVDAADEAGVAAAVESACAGWDCNLEAIFHLAGRYHDRPLLDETPESFRELLHPKVAGAMALHRVALRHPGCAFVGFSSAVAHFGGAMIGAYVVANRFLSGFAHFQRSQGVRSICLEWSTWDQTGMSRGYGGKDPLRARGFVDMSVRQGVDSLIAALHRDEPELTIGLDGANGFVRRNSALAGDACRIEQALAYCQASSAPAALESTDRYGVAFTGGIRRLAALPTTEDGQLDREALADLGRALAGGARRVAARTESEKRVLTLWQEVLGASGIGVFDNFFELGGHSLLATRVIARLRDEFGVELPLRRLFESPTVAGICEWLDGDAAGEETGRIERASRDQDLPLSFTQQRLWFIDQMEPGNPVYNIPVAFRIDGALDVAALQRALDEIVRRHEALRTRFPSRDGIPSQEILPELSIPLPRRDATDDQVDGILLEASRAPFDLARGPLLRALLLNLGDERRILLVITHHIVFDGWSIAVFNGELSALYGAYAAGAESPLAELPIQYADYALWQRQTLQGEALESQVAYWKEKLAGAPPALTLPTDRPRPAAPSSRGAKVFFSLPLALADSARAVSQQYGTTPFMTLLAAFQTLLRRASGQDDICVGSPIAGRTHTETEPLIGFLANTLVLRTEFAGDPSFGDILGRVRESAVGAYANQETPLARLVEALRPPRDPSRNPLFQANFRLQTIEPVPLSLEGLRVAPIETDSGIARFDIAMELWSYPGRFGGYVEYSTDLFDEARVRCLVTQFEETLAAALAAPDRPLSALFPPDEPAPSRPRSLRESRRKAVLLD